MPKPRKLPIGLYNAYFIPIEATLQLVFPKEGHVESFLQEALKKGKTLSKEHNKNDFAKNVVLAPTAGKDVGAENIDDLCGVAVEAKITRVVEEAEAYAVVFETIRKVEIKSIVNKEYPYIAAVSTIWLFGADTLEAKYLRQDIYEVTDGLCKAGIASPNILDVFHKKTNLHALADVLLIHLIEEAGVFETAEEQKELFEEINVVKLFKKIYRVLSDRLLEQKIQNRVGERFSKMQDEALLREKMKNIQNELNRETGDETEDDVEEIAEKIKQAKMPPGVEEIAKKELNHYAGINPQSVEKTVVRDYLDQLCSYPWSIETEDNFDLKNARAILDRDHYGLEKVKRRVIEFLAVKVLNPKKKGAVICFDGPPGTGKTSVAHSIAEALGRNYIRISLGGIDDEAKIRGHRRTYVGALPGCIVKAMIDAGTKNPIIILDEIDKIRASMRGDPSGALLEVLDPTVNSSFSDHYFGPGAEIDLSDVIFICTSNYKEHIQPTLYDRLEIIDFDGYTTIEKIHIAKRHLISEEIEENGLSGLDIELDDDTIRHIILQYTREGGVRTLKRTIATVLRSRAVKIANNEPFNQTIKKEELQEILGPPIFLKRDMVHVEEPGYVTGLAYTPSGGCTLGIEALKLPKSKKKDKEINLQITGKLGRVMQESARVALTTAINTCVACNLEEMNMDPEYVKKFDYHVHCDDHDIGKEGPSAGAAITLCLISVIIEKPVKENLAMTGEINLRGQVMPIGGVKQKLLAAHRAGYTNIFIPKRNEKDLTELPKEVLDDLNIMLAKNINEIVEFAFEK